MELEYLDPVYCKAGKKLKKIISPKLLYKSAWWKDGQFSKKKISTTKSMIDLRSGVFYTGFLQTILEYLEKKKIKNIDFNFDKQEKVDYIKEPKLKNVTLREDQLNLINNALISQRGIILSPTGSGKSYIAGGIISCLKNKNILFLCHNISILSQTAKSFKKFGLKNINFIRGENKKLKKGITISSIQSFISIPEDEYCDFFDCIIVDEAHRCIGKKSQYTKVLTRSLCFMKIGFTATLPEGKEKQLTLEGLIGPVIGEVTKEKSIKEGYIAKPIIKLLTFQYNPLLSDIKQTYTNIYDHGIVKNKYRNKKIIKTVISRNKKNKTCLIMIRDIEHGKILMEMFKQYDYDDKIFFVKGNTELKIRDEMKNALNNKNIKCVIATSVWREGISIETLNCVILALGGKSSIQILQAIGRGTRISEGKNTVEIIDFVDRAKYLSQHFCERLNIYLENKWL